MTLQFLTEPKPIRGQATSVGPGIRRIVAQNPGPLTYHGTNTYLIDDEDGTAVLDPGPEDQAHVAAILAATGGRLSCIIFTHRHRDHVGAVAALKAATDAPIVGYPGGSQSALHPDIPIREGAPVAGMTALHAPGHTSDHLCFTRDDGVLFSGDHVMSWNSSIVSPPDGSMAAYFESLQRLLDRDDRIFLPGHGPPLPDPRRFVHALLAHRRMREAAIARAIKQRPLTASQLVDLLYGGVDAAVKLAAECNVVAHLEKLRKERRAFVADDGRWRAA